MNNIKTFEYMLALHIWVSNTSDANLLAKKLMPYIKQLAKEAYEAGGNGGYYDEGLGGMNYEYSEEKWNEFIKTKL
jgi:hypothetical protein